MARITFSSKINIFVKSKIFLLLMVLVFIFMADTFQLRNADVERVKVWKIILGLFTPLVISSVAYLSHQVVQKKIKRIYLGL